MEKNDTISILYVEDQDDVRLFLSKILSRHYSNIILAENGKDGLDLYHKHRPDIVITDIKMPVMDGLSMSSRIKESNPKAQIILTTAHSDMEYFIQSIDIGINQYILKPIDREKLYAAIDNCKDQVLLEREIENQNKKLKENNEKLTRQERELRENLQKSIALKEIISKSEENFRKVAENIQDAFWLSDRHKVLFVNNAFETISGLSSSVIYDNPSAYKEYIHEEDKSQFLILLKEHEANHKGSMGTEFRIKTPAGEIKNIWYRDVFIDNEKERGLRRICMLSDISWKIEKEKLQNDLLIAREAAQIKHRLLANVSHEMRTPLNGIFAMSEILAATTLTDQQAEYLATIREAGEDMLEITNSLLDIHELEYNQVQVNMQPIRIREFFAEVSGKYEKLTLSKGLKFQSTIAANVPEIIISDPRRLRQVAELLLSNALKFTEKGEIKAEITSEEIDHDFRNIIIKISDTGKGIREDYLDKIFSLFSQQDDSDARSYDGLGLGLTICQRIALLLKGAIEVDSEEGKGSVFSFILPVKNEAKDRQIFSQNKPPQLGLTVLYAEDKEVNQKIISIMLQNTGCRVDIAQNGLEAIEKFKEKNYDIILMDIQMPVMDGITATKKLREEFSNLPPIIGISANALKADAQFYIDQGLDDYISKPVSPKILYQKISEWLQEKNEKNETGKIPDSIPEEIENLEEKVDLDWETLTTLREQTNNNEDIIKDLYGTFLLEADVMMENIKNAISENDNESLNQSTHSLKGLSATIGAMKVYHICSEMDCLHKEKSFSRSEPLFILLSRYYKLLKAIIRKEVLHENL
ncbi:MAG: response regulator [Bacteroidetes bacterium]|nr:MAG: response regulator [Bacteroidota bacterium]